MFESFHSLPFELNRIQLVLLRFMKFVCFKPVVCVNFSNSVFSLFTSSESDLLDINKLVLSTSMMNWSIDQVCLVLSLSHIVGPMETKTTGSRPRQTFANI